MCSMLFFTIIVAGAFVGTIATNYCNIRSCKELRGGAVHTMCKYTSPQPSSNCGAWSNGHITAADKQAILKAHNDARRKVAAGKEIRGNPGPQPAASNMPDLTWDNELATIAQRWVNQCDFRHDDCCDVDRYMVGQNLAMAGSTVKGPCNFNNLIQLWINEVKDFNAKDVHKMPGYNTNPAYFKKIGHYTQVVWGKTTKVGCGIIQYPKNGFYYCYLGCNYGPAGNFAGSPIYQTK